MARWLREYFNLGGYKAKAPAKAETTAAAGKKKKKKPCSESGSCRESDLMRAYRLQKERDFEDPYSNGPGSSLRRLKAMWPGPEDEKEEGGCRQGPVASGSPMLQRSQSERAASSSPRAMYIGSAQHRLIKVHGTAVTEKAVGNWSSPATGSRKSPQPDDKVAFRDDYSDPFDAKNELKNKVVKKREIENNGYMEPYEAQKMMAEIHKQESQKKGIQLYDTPYEPEENGASDTESVDSYLRESRLPQGDARPAEEYDQPWEWNVTVPPFSVQLNGIEKRQSSPLCDRRRQLVPPDLIKHGGLEFSDIVGERIDPSTPLEKQVWYHGAISRTDAENLLRLCKECSYLIRNSQSSKNDYSLSLKSSQGFMHMKLTRAKDKYILGQNSLPFNSVPEVIHYYTTRKLPIKGAEHLSLLYPVTVRTL
ncbi:SH2 domain-containing adapter protein F-like [Mobula birostris]|uniref:SH2 domain-containing adapter protein F-like n=1 Tax=Mobula birostris TaxID=1983395 RepID=UPI003B27EDED